jgi:hypothetical protein
MKALLAALALATLAGCSLLQPPRPGGGQLDPLGLRQPGRVLWRFTDAGCGRRAPGGGDQVYRLKSEPGASGALYSDGVLAFHTKGQAWCTGWRPTI